MFGLLCFSKAVFHKKGFHKGVSRGSERRTFCNDGRILLAAPNVMKELKFERAHSILSVPSQISCRKATAASGQKLLELCISQSAQLAKGAVDVSGEKVGLSVILRLAVYILHASGEADKSLAQPTSRCRRTESIVSSERGVCSCAEL